jgi:transporter family protein
MEWLIFAALSAVTAALAAIFSKMGVKDIDPTVATVVRAAIMFVVVFLAGLHTNKLSEITAIDRRSLFYILLIGIAGGLS